MEEYSRYSRQMILKEIGREGQRLLEESRVAAVGLGALGSVSANLLARAGVGYLKLIDRDYLEINNLQRQILFDETDLSNNLPKAIAAEQKLRGINSEITIEAETADLNPETIEGLLSGVDLIIDGTDNFETRYLLNDYSLKKKIPWIYGGAIRTEGMSYVTLPEDGPCLRCLFGAAPDSGSIQTCDQVGILAPVAHLIASFQTMEAIKILARHFEAVERALWKVDLWSRQFKTISVEHLKEAPCSGCQNREYPYLNRRLGARTVTLCGRNAVQILGHSAAGPIDFKQLAQRLSLEGEVKFNDYLLQYRLASYEITVFSNGRAIVKGTENPDQARNLYSRYIGA